MAKCKGKTEKPAGGKSEKPMGKDKKDSGKKKPC
jgi:hypothetical protein